MKLRYLFSMCALLGLMTAQPALAVPVKSGPYGDPVGFPQGGDPVYQETGPYKSYRWTKYAPDPLNPEHPWQFYESNSKIPGPPGDGWGLPLETSWSDRVTASLSLPTDTSGRAYHEIDLDSPADYETAMIEITTLFGLKVGGYSGDVGAMTGFDPNSTPNIIEKGYYGASGTYYAAYDHQVMTLSALSDTYSSELDLSQWTGDPASMVHLFRTTMPAADAVVVPEPTSLVLFAAGAVGLMGFRFRKRFARATRNGK